MAMDLGHTHISISDLVDHEIAANFLKTRASKDPESLSSGFAKLSSGSQRHMSQRERDAEMLKQSEEGAVGGLPSTDANPIQVIKEEIREFRTLQDQREEGAPLRAAPPAP